MLAPSPRWLGLAEGLWWALLVETCGGAGLGALRSMLDALQRRCEGELAAAQFAQVFARWAAEGPAREPKVSKAAFCTELGARELAERKLALMFATVVNERNRIVLAGLKAAPERLQKTRMRLALCEKVFFSLDREGRGFVTLDDVLGLVVTQETDAWENRRASLSPEETFKMRDRMTSLRMQDAAVATMRTLAGDDELRDGVLTLGRFKTHCLRVNEAQGAGRSRSSGSSRPPLTLDDMGLQRILVTLSAHEDVFAEVAGCWSVAVRRGVDGGSQDTTTVALARFLSVQGPRIRLAKHAPGRQWGAPEDVEVLWKAFARGSAARSQIKWKRLMERVASRFGEQLNELIVRFFGEPLPAPEPSPRPTSQRALANGHRKRDARTGSRLPRGPAASESVARYMVDLEALSGGEESEGAGHGSPAVGNGALTAASGPASSRANGSADDSSSAPSSRPKGPALSASSLALSPAAPPGRSRSGDASAFAPSPQSPGRAMQQRDGAQIIQGFKLFEAEKSKLFGFSHAQVSALWDGLTRDEKQIYVEMARAAAVDTDENASRVGNAGSAVLSSEAATDSLAGNPASFVSVQVPSQDTALLRSRLRERSVASPSNLAEAVWTPLSLDAAIERMLADRLSPGGGSPLGSGSRGAAQTFPGAEPEEEALLRRGIPLRRSESVVREGVLRTHAQGVAGPRELYAKLLLGAQLRASELVLSSSDGLTTVGRISLQSATVARGLERSAHCLLLRAGGDKLWKLYTDSHEDLDAWVVDLCFVIAAAGAEPATSPQVTRFWSQAVPPSREPSANGPRASWGGDGSFCNGLDGRFGGGGSSSRSTSSSSHASALSRSSSRSSMAGPPPPDVEPSQARRQGAATSPVRDRDSPGLPYGVQHRERKASPLSLQLPSPLGSNSSQQPNMDRPLAHARSAITPMTQQDDPEDPGDQDERLRQLEKAARMLRHAAEGMNAAAPPVRVPSPLPQMKAFRGARERTDTDDYPAVPSRRPPSDPDDMSDRREGGEDSTSDASFEDCEES